MILFDLRGSSNSDQLWGLLNKIDVTVLNTPWLCWIHFWLIKHTFNHLQQHVLAMVLVWTVQQTIPHVMVSLDSVLVRVMWQGGPVTPVVILSGNWAQVMKRDVKVWIKECAIPETIHVTYSVRGANNFNFFLEGTYMYMYVWPSFGRTEQECGLTFFSKFYVYLSLFTYHLVKKFVQIYCSTKV